MSGAAGSFEEYQGGIGRWGACLAAVLAAHLGVGALLLSQTSVTVEPPPPALPVDLTPPLPELESPPPAPAPPLAEALPPEPVQPPPPEVAPPRPPEPVLQPPPEPPLSPPLPEPPAPVALPIPPPRPMSRPVPHPRPPPPRLVPAPRVEAPPAPPPPVAAQPAPPAPRPQASAAAVSNWQSRLFGHLLRLKRYPAEAQMRRQEGTPIVQFTAARDGRVLSAHLARSSGNDVLDQEALALVQRAQPLPAFTDDMPEPARTVLVPVQFSLR